jgi:integrase/recombinase XerD
MDHTDQDRQNVYLHILKECKMKYILNHKENINDSLLFWMERYIAYKLTSLSRRHIEDESKLHRLINIIKQGLDSIEQLDVEVKKARKMGMLSISHYFNPLKKNYMHI